MLRFKNCNGNYIFLDEVPDYGDNTICYEMFIEARKEDIKNIKLAIKKANKRKMYLIITKYLNNLLNLVKR